MPDAALKDKLSLYAQSSGFTCADACPRFGCRGEIYLFGCRGFTVDLRSDIVETSGTIQGTLPFAAFEASLDRLLKKGRVYQTVREKMATLDDGRIGDLAGALSIAEVIVERSS